MQRAPEDWLPLVLVTVPELQDKDNLSIPELSDKDKPTAIARQSIEGCWNSAELRAEVSAFVFRH